jgi:hypothetical protein
MAKPKTKINEIVALIEKHGPVSPNRLTEITGDFRQSIDKYVRQAHDAGLIHVAAFGPSPFGGNRTVKLYAAGKGVNVQRPGKKSTKPRKIKNVGSRRCMNFSSAEKRIIREIKLSGQAVKLQLHRLPGRTLHGIQKAVASLDGKKKRGVGSWIWTGVLSVLHDEPNLAVRDISSRIGCTSRQVTTLLNEHRGHGVFISGWEVHCRSTAATWSLGNQADVPKPPLQTVEERRAKARARHQRRNALAQTNPFAIALGLVPAPIVGTGRVFQQGMSIRAAA